MTTFMDAAQLSFFEEPAAVQFREFHHANGHVYRRLVELAREFRALNGPDARCGIELLYGKLRWELMVETRGDQFRLNDHWTAYYARLIMANEADLNGMFVTRKSKADQC